ncbi:MAG: hypothetical protein C0418_03535 [Coriobacteriaceae bacterium]|nr:hypothetical protein [Coriobacteriaceae bacterium]
MVPLRRLPRGRHVRRHPSMRAAALVAVTALALVSPCAGPSALGATSAKPFDGARAMTHVRRIAAYGPRVQGGTAERKALGYAANQLKSWGYAVRWQTVTLPGGRTSRNIYAERRGRSADVVLLGAHIDSKYPSPGANDNATGASVLLELARDVASMTPEPTLRFVLFGAEEMSGRTDENAHHYGSRQYVAALSPAARQRIAAMVSVDMVGYGTVFNVRSMRRGPQTAVRSLQAYGSSVGRPLVFRLDSGASGWSDHEPFELAGIPAAWVQWRSDPAIHTARDTAAHIQSARVTATGRLLRGWLLSLDAADLDALRP